MLIFTESNYIPYSVVKESSPTKLSLCISSIKLCVIYLKNGNNIHLVLFRM